MRLRWKVWSKDEDKKLAKLCATYLSTGVNGLPSIPSSAWGKIADEMPGRSPGACKSHYVDLKAELEGRPGRNRERARVINPKYVTHRFDAQVARFQAPIDLPPPASITAWIFGDPLPGRSALDRKREPA